MKTRTFLAVLTALALLVFFTCKNESNTPNGPNNIIDDPNRPSKPTPENPWPDTTVTITNDSFWFDTGEGTLINENKLLVSQSGGLFDFIDPETGKDRHYWYGIYYNGAMAYYDNPTRNALTEHNDFNSITCYSSMDLANWRPEGKMLTRQGLDAAGYTKKYLGRMGAAYLPEADKKYLLVIQYNTDGNSSVEEIMIAWADTPTGPFTVHRLINIKAEVGIYTGDETVFADDDGKYYLVASTGSGRKQIHILRIAWDAENEQVYFANPKNPNTPKDFTTMPQIYQALTDEKEDGMEGNCMFKHEGKYYSTGGPLYGWNASPAKYQVSDNGLVGSYLPTFNSTYDMVNAKKDFSHITQTGFYYTLKGTKQTTVIYCGDRWADFCSNGIGYNQWVPLSFDGDKVVFNSLSQWTLNPKTGEWAVGEGNNYVLNGTFEADRVPVSTVAGWTYSGTGITNDSSGNNRIGKYHMGFRTSSVPSGISQEITLPDGDYLLRAHVWVTSGISGVTTAELYAGTAVRDLKTAGTSWAPIEPLPVTVTDGKITVGVRVEGIPSGQIVRVDNITLIKASYPYVEP